MTQPPETGRDTNLGLPGAANGRMLAARDQNCAGTDPYVDISDCCVPVWPDDAEEGSSFSGLYECRHLSCGPRLEVSALTALRSGRYSGTLKRCLTLGLVIDGAPLNLSVHDEMELTVQRGQALLIASQGGDDVAYMFRAGTSSRCLLLQTRPEDIVDADLAALVDEAITATWVTQLPAGTWSPRIADFATERAPICRLVEESCALGLLAEALRTLNGGSGAANAAISPTDRRKMLHVRDLLIAAPDKEHRLADLAREAGVSVTALKRKFTAAFGQPVFAYLRDVRLDRARAGIEHEGWSATKAAYTVGYRNLGGFSDAFRRKFGVLPSELRRGAKTGPLP